MDYDSRSLARVEPPSCAAPVRVADLDCAHERAWARYVDAHPQATLYHSLAWRRVVHVAFGHQTHYLYAHRGGRVTGVLPLARLCSRLFGDFLVSLPQVNYGGALADSAETAVALMEAAGARAAALGCRHVELRDTAARADWPVRTDKVVMELALPASVDELWARFDSKLRAQIRRADKEGVQIVRGGAELLPEFYTVFARNMRDLGTPVYARGFFAAIAAGFPQATTLVVCRLGGRAVAAGFLLRHRERVEIPWAASVREYNRLGVNMALYWAALRAAIGQGCRVFDYGRSTVDSGTYRFKKQWGAVPRPLYWHYWLNDGVAMPALTPGNPKYRRAIAAWQRLPLFVANRLGPMLVKHLP